jgi:hypothetical protein
MPAQPLTEFHENLSLTYPHAGGFADGGRSIVLGGRMPETAALWKVDVTDFSRRTRLLEASRAEQPEGQLWSDIALAANRLVTVADNAVYVMDLGRDDQPRRIYRASGEQRLHPLPGIRPDGGKVVVVQQEAGRWSGLELDVTGGAPRVLFTKPWRVTHLHYCGFDPTWIGFSHEGKCWEVRDRVWAWHEALAPEGACVFEQFPDDPQRALYAGHERWTHHDASALVICYGEGPGSPRGIYEAFADGRPQRLVGEGPRDWHLDVSRDGRWVAIDTTGPHDAPGRGWENAEKVSDILVMDRATGERRFIGRSRLSVHPSHPHPVFSLDGRHLYYNEAHATEPGLNRVWRAENPFYPHEA